MPYPQAGLGAVPTLPAGADPATLDTAFALAVNLKAEPDTAAGYADYYAASDAILAGGRRNVLVQYPVLAAVIASTIASQVNNPARTVGDILSDMLLVNDTIASGSPWAGMWSDVWGSDPPGTYGADPTSPGAIYERTAQYALSVLRGASELTQSGNPAQAAATAARMAWNAALAQSAYTTPSGFRVPTAYILDGPTALPDGTVYLQYHDPVAAADGSPADFVLWWNGPQYQPPHTSPGNPYVKTLENQILQLRDRGTGDWYRCMAVYNDDQSCRPPLNWTGGYDLPPAILASLGTQGGAVAHAGTIPPPPAMAVDADGNPINGPTSTAPSAPPAAMLAPPPAVSAPPVTSAPVVVTQDQDGNLIPPVVVSSTPAPAVEVSTLPSAAVSAPATSSAGIPPLAIAAAAGLALWLFTRGRR